MTLGHPVVEDQEVMGVLRPWVPVRVLLCCVVATLMSASGALAHSGHPRTTEELCEQATHHTGRLAHSQIGDTTDCFTVLSQVVSVNDGNVQSIANACQDLPTEAQQHSGAGEVGDSLEGLQQASKTDKVKAGYFNRESRWYRHRKPHLSKALAKVAEEIGSATKVQTAFYKEVGRFGNLVALGNCGLAQNDAAELRTLDPKVDDATKSLDKALKKL